MANVKAIPESYHSVTPSIIVNDTKKAIDFYKRAFGAVENGIFVGPNGKVMHADITIGNSHVMLCDEMPEMKAFSPATLKGSPASLWIYTENADALFERAVKAGAQIKMPLADAFWGDRWGSLADPFGYHWSIATRKENLLPEETKKRGEEFFASMKSKCQQ